MTLFDSFGLLIFTILTIFSRFLVHLKNGEQTRFRTLFLSIFSYLYLKRIFKLNKKIINKKERRNILSKNKEEHYKKYNKPIILIKFSTSCF